MLTEKYRVECKTTSKGSYAIKTDVWEKIKEEADQSNKIPLLVFDLYDKERYVVFDQSDFFEDVYQEGKTALQYTFHGCEEFEVVTLRPRKPYMGTHCLMVMPFREFKEMEECE